MMLRLPALREELVVQEGPRMHDGQPSWTLHDPARNRFFRLDWLTFEIFRRWSLGDAATIAQAVHEQTPLRPEAGDVMAVLNFAGANQLLVFAGANNSRVLAEHRERAQPNWWQWLVHNYLFFRIPLIRPEALLRTLHGKLQFLFTRGFWCLTGLAAATGFALLWRQWDQFKATWMDFTSLDGFLGYFFVLVGVKALHEFGHGIVATHFGCRVPTMGLAFLVMTPVAYTDTNDAWRLTDRKPRLWIGGAGMLAEVALAAWATLAWGLLPEGYLRSVAFMVATTTWIKSVLVNTSPIMRFDGYYLLSDALDLPNLHTRAFALARWQLREWLFQLGDEPPEYFRPSLRRGLIGLSFFIWCYRLVVFTGIAIFVYHFFFKALGIVLFAVEIAWFVALPIVSELKTWITRRRAILKSPRRWRLLVAALVAAVLVSIPWPQRVRLIAQYTPGEEFKITAPESAQLLALGARDGETVRAGQTVVQLDSAALRFRLEKAKAHEASLVEQITSAGTNPALRSRLSVMQSELEAAQAARREAETALAKLQPTAPFDGIFRVADCDLRPGETVSKQEQIASVVSPRGGQVVAYLDERYTHLIESGATATLYLDGAPGRSVKLHVASVDADASRSLSHPMLTSQFGGELPAHLIDGELIPENAVYRVTLQPDETPADFSTQSRRGHVVIRARSESMITRWTKAALSVFWREFGF